MSHIIRSHRSQREEIALLELLRAPEVYVEADWDELVGKVREAVEVGEVRVDVMRTVVPGEHNRGMRDNFARLESDALENA